ncbi:transposase [Streptomyces auratus AGR0001]|uniref:Transposase n=1 Tax=Streptomyces auratus AGR0001 TaxID=1160718 RepID=A0A8B1N3J1_9ACTN|nr:transposase [Streptomyces auratus AGR0001]
MIELIERAPAPRCELTYSGWELISPHLPIGHYGPYPENLRDQLEGIIWRFRTGSPWRDVPEALWSWARRSCPPWRRLPKRGHAKGAKAAQAAGHCRAGDPGRGGRVRPGARGTPPARIRRRRRRARLKAALGRSRGGLTCKVHPSAERRCRPLSFVLTPGAAATGAVRSPPAGAWGAERARTVGAVPRDQVRRRQPAGTERPAADPAVPPERPRRWP